MKLHVTLKLHRLLLTHCTHRALLHILFMIHYRICISCRNAFTHSIVVAGWLAGWMLYCDRIIVSSGFVRVAL